MEIKKMEPVIEAILFAAGEPVGLEKLCEALEVDRKTLKLIMANLIDTYNKSPRGMMLREIDGAYQLCTKPQYYDYIKKVMETRQKQGISQAAFEALSIIAYNQPITKAKVEQIRGVNSDSAITKLLERNLIREAGRMDAPGRPMLFETTEEFLRSFGFKSVKDLPQLEINNFQELQAEMEEKSEN